MDGEFYSQEAKIIAAEICGDQSEFKKTAQNSFSPEMQQTSRLRNRGENHAGSSGGLTFASDSPDSLEELSAEAGELVSRLNWVSGEISYVFSQPSPCIVLHQGYLVGG